MVKKEQSVEPNIADLANGWLKSYKLRNCSVRRPKES